MSASPTVMVVDDDAPLRESVCELLEERGFHVIGMDGAQAALQRLRSDPSPPDVILLDLMMPGMTGWQFRDEQLRDPTLAAIPVVVMTATRDVRGIAADDIVYKPLRLATLLDVVGRYAKPATSPPATASQRSVAPLLLDPGHRSEGEQGRRIRAFDWSATSLGAMSSWPASLRSALDICLGSRFPIAIYWGVDLTLLYNDAWSPILGNKHPRALGRPGIEVWPELWDTIGPMFEHVMRTGESTYAEDSLLLMRRHGYTEECYFNYTFTPIRGQGVVDGIFNAVIETTFRVVAERRTRVLRELAERTVAVRSADEACAIAAEVLTADGHDAPYCAIYCTDEAYTEAKRIAIAGLPAGSPAAPPIVPLDREPEERSLLGLADKARSIEELSRLDERLGPLPGGPWSDPSTSALVAPIAGGASGRPTGWLVIGASPRRAVDDEYRQFAERAATYLASAIASANAYEAERARAEALAEIDRAKTTFFSNVSHEFRTPLTLMLGPAQDLLRGVHGELREEQREQLALMHRNGVRMQKLVNALLDFSRLEAGRVEATYEAVDLADATRELASAFEPAVRRAGVELVVDCPALDQAIHVDRDMWEKIVLNLLSNALKFTFEGRIEVSLRSEDQHAVLRVKDTGIGIAEHELPRLFERFHRVEGARARTHEGSGIGLALAQELVRLHGGTVSVQSRPGVGSEFTVTIRKGTAHLPRDRVPAKRSGERIGPGVAPFVQEALGWSGEIHDVEPSGADRRDVEPERRAARILLAEDNADMREYVRLHLVRDFVVEAVEDGTRALAAARANPPDLIVTDVMMPGLDGFALLRELRANPRTRHIPVVMLSARAGEEAKVEGLQAGAEDYLTKPFSARELLARVRTHVELARLRAELAASNERLYALFVQAPAPIAVLRGADLVFELANDRYIEVVGGRDVRGKPLLDALPELRGQGFDDLLRGVMASGQAYEGEESFVRLQRDGVVEDTWWNFVYSPLASHDGTSRAMVLGLDVTPQVVARRAIEHSEEKFRRIVTQVQAGIAQTDFTGRFTLTNARYREIVGRSADELLQLRMQDITHPDDLGASETHFSRLLEQGTPFVIEARHVKPDGSLVWVQNSVSRVDDVTGQAQGVVTVAIDITQRRFAEQALRESEQRFRNMADNAPVMVWVTEFDGQCSYLSRSWYEFTGQTPETGLGFGWLDAVHPDDRERSNAMFVEANERRAPFGVEYRLRRADGEYRWAIDSAAPRVAPDGAFLGYIGSVIDITERRVAELALASSEARFRAIFETAEVAIFEEDFTRVVELVHELQARHGGELRAFLMENPAVVEDAIGRVGVLDVNPAALRMFDAASKAELIGSLDRVLLPETRSVFVDEMIAIAQARSVFTAEATLCTLRGERIDVAMTMSVPSAGGAEARALVTLMDVSERKREREARLAEMERAVRFSEMFVGILGHDLRNPLGAIVMGAQILEMHADNERIAKPVARIASSAARMERMISQLLDFTRIRLGRGLPLEPSRVDLAELTRALIDEIEPVQKCDIRLEVAGDVIGTWDRDRLAQLVSNLVANACQHRVSGAPVRVWLDGTQREHARIEVWNPGAIPPDVLPVLFEPLRAGAVRAARDGSAGLGLGLYITREIAGAHGGTIRAESTEASGTRLVVELPRSPPRGSEHPFGRS